MYVKSRIFRSRVMIDPRLGEAIASEANIVFEPLIERKRHIKVEVGQLNITSSNDLNAAFSESGKLLSLEECNAFIPDPARTIFVSITFVENNAEKNKGFNADAFVINLAIRTRRIVLLRSKSTSKLRFYLQPLIDLPASLIAGSTGFLRPAIDTAASFFAAGEKSELIFFG